MRLKTYLAAATALLSTSYALEDDIPAPTSAPVGSKMDDLIPSATPFPHVEIRQNLGQALPGQVSAAPVGQVPPVTIYSILSQVGATAKPMVYTYTQIFPKVPDQFPVAKPGQIGMGGHKRREEKRDAVPAVNTEYVAKPLVLQMETIMIIQDVQKVTEVLVMETWTVNVRDQATPTSDAAELSYSPSPAPAGPTASGVQPAAAT